MKTQPRYRQLIENNKIKEVLNELHEAPIEGSDFHDVVTLLKSRLQRFQKQDWQGVLEHHGEFMQIKAAILGLIGEHSEELKSKTRLLDTPPDYSEASTLAGTSEIEDYLQDKETKVSEYFARLMADKALNTEQYQQVQALLEKFKHLHRRYLTAHQQEKKIMVHELGKDIQVVMAETEDWAEKHQKPRPPLYVELAGAAKNPFALPGAKSLARGKKSTLPKGKTKSAFPKSSRGSG